MPTERPVTVIRDAAQLTELLPRLAAAEAIAVDTETTALSPLDGRLRLLSLATDDDLVVVDAFAVPDLSPLAPLLAAPKPFKVLHNAKFDLRWLAHHHGLAVSGIFDTMLAAQLLGELPHFRLEALALHYLGEPMDKSAQLSDWSGTLSESQIAYAARDVEVLLPLRKLLRQRLIDAGLVRVAALEFGTVPVVAAMEQSGVLLDVAAWQRILEKLRGEHAAMSAELQGMLAGTRRQLSLLPDVVPVINLNSTQQLRGALADLGVQVPDTHERTLLTVQDQHPIVPKILAYRGLQKAISSYGEGLLEHVHPATGRIHANFQQLMTSTGRFSCSHPNLQNIPNTPEYRACFVAPPGHKLVVADYSQIELRILAEVSGDMSFRRAFHAGVDLHRMTASEMFCVPFDTVTKTQRGQAKSINFGLVYGRGAPSLAGQLGVDVETARGLIQRYFETYRDVGRWLEETARVAIRERELRSLAGRRARFHFDPSDRGQVASVERQAKNFPIQATNADILKQAMTMLTAALSPYGARLVNCVHDELVVEAPTEAAEAAAEALRQTMEEAARVFLREVPVAVEVAVADAWIK
ncbi:MAG TPA: DNA polymerase [Oscillatoriaceae cyanobacterium]